MPRNTTLQIRQPRRLCRRLNASVLTVSGIPHNPIYSVSADIASPDFPDNPTSTVTVTENERTTVAFLERETKVTDLKETSLAPLTVE